MPSQYTSFQINNTTDVPMIISVNDPDGNAHTVGTLEPGKESTQHAPMGATWSIELATPAAQEHVQSPKDVTQPSPSDPGASDMGGGSVKPSILNIGTKNVAPPSTVPQTFSSDTVSVAKSSERRTPDPSNTGVSIPRNPLQDDNLEPTKYEAFLKLETGTHTARINQLLVTPDSKTLITAGRDKTIRVWDIETKKQVRMLLGQIGNGDNGNIQRIALSRDGKYVIALVWLNLEGTRGDHDRETDVRVYELATGNLQARFRYPGTLQDLDFSPDDKYLAMVGNPKQPIRRGYVQVYDTSALLQGFGAALTPLASEALYEYNALIPAYVRFVPDNQAKSAGYRIVVATWYAHKYQNPEYTGGLLWYSFSSAGVLTKNKDASRETEDRLAPDSLAVSRDFVVVTAHGDVKKFYCHDHNGKLLKTVLSESIPTAPAFSQDESQLIVGQSRDSALVQVSVYNTALGQFQLKSTYHDHDSEVIAVAVLKDGTAVSAGGDQNAIHFWNPSHFEGEQTGVIKGVGRVIHALGINQDEQIGIGTHDDLRLEDSIVLQRVFDLHTMTLNSLSIADAAAFQRAQKRAGTQWLEWNDANLWLRTDDQTSYDQPLTGTPDPNQEGSFIWYNATTFGFTEKNFTIVTGAADGKVRVAPRGANGFYRSPPWRFLVGHTAALRDHAALGRWLVTAGADQIIRLWYLNDVEQDSMEDLQPTLNLFVGSDDEWVIWSKSGYYNASQHGDRHIGYHVNRGADKEALYFPSDRFKAFLRPDIIKAIVEHGSEDRAIAQGFAIPKFDVSKNLPPIIELTENGVQISDDGTEVIFTFSVDTHAQPLTRVWALRNGRLVHAQEAVPPNIMTLPLLPGENRFKIFAENQYAKSNPIEQTVIGKGRLDQFVGSNGTLYVLAIGVSKLENEAPESNFKNLNYAHSDAIAIYNAFAKDIDSSQLEGPAQPFNNEAFEAVDRTLLVNDQAKLMRIEEELDKICARITDKFNKRVENREAAKRDVLLVFLSGHGVFRTRNQQLYFWNFDFDLENPGDTGLSFMELGEKITSLPAEVILMTDACHSGMAGGDVVKGIDPNELAKRIYGINETEMYIFNAARRSEKAREDPSIIQPTISHGYFTRAVLDILFDEKNPKVSMLGLIDQVQWGVQRYTTLQTPVCRMYGDLLPLVIYEKKYLLSNK